MNLKLLLALDRNLFFAINQLPHTDLFNAAGTLFSAGSGFIWYFLVGLFLFTRNRGKGAQSLFALILAALLTHLIVLLLFKPLIARPRPDLVHDQATVVSSPIESIAPFAISADFAFPSGHATMAFAGAVILSSVLKKQSKWWYLLATGVALSRIYLGKHYPSDVVAGALLGIVVGWLSLRILLNLFKIHKEQ